MKLKFETKIRGYYLRMSEKENFWNKKAGGFSLGLFLIIAYIGFKSIRTSWTSPYFWWYSIWFMAIVINSLTSDLFENSTSWIYTSLEKLETSEMSPEDKLKYIRTQLSIAVSRYNSVFLMLSGRSNFSGTIKKIFTGKISIKELLIVFAYAMYDLVLRDTNLSFMEPFDIAVLFGVIVFLKIIDANSGFAGLVAEMYEEAFKERNTDETLEIMVSYIKQLCRKFHIEYEKTEKVTDSAGEG
jgi:hypothetical protein